MKSKKFYVLLVVFLFMITQIVSAVESTNEAVSLDFSVSANPEQLKLVNSLDMNNMTIGEKLRIIFPEEYSSLSPEIRLEIDKQFTNTNNTYKYSYNSLASRSGDYDSEIRKNGNAIEFSSWNDHPTIASYVETYLISVETGDSVCYDIAIKFGTESSPVSYVKASNMADVPTGYYYTHGQHCWKVKDEEIKENLIGMNNIIYLIH